MTILLFLSRYLVFVIPVILLAYIVTHDKKKRATFEAGVMTLSFVLGGTFAVLLQNLTDSGLPSASVAILFALATTIYFYHARLAWLTYFIAIALGAIRIYLGEQTSANVYGGVVLGILVGIFVNYIIHTFFLKRVK